MIYLDYIFIVVFALFLASRRTRATAIVILAGYFAYWAFALQLHGLSRYAFIASINAISALYLTFIYRDYDVAILFYLAIPIGFAGGVLHSSYYPAYYYDNMCIIIMALQVFALLIRVGLNGINLRSGEFHSLYGCITNDSCKGLTKMRQSKSKKEAD